MPSIEFKVPVLGERNDIPDNELPTNALRLCQNMMRSKNGTLDIRPGHERIGDDGPGGRIVGLVRFKTASGTEKIVAANKTGWWHWDGSDWNDISGTALSGDDDDLARFQVFPVSGAFKVIGVNEANSPKIWDGVAATYSDLGGSPPTAIDVSAAANRLLLLASPDNVRISDFNNPEVWPSGGGYSVRLPDVGDEMIGLGAMSRTSVGIFGEQSQYIARAQSGSSPFRFEKVSDQIGPLSKAVTVGVGGVRWYLGDDGSIYRFDGNPCVEVSRAMQKFVQENLHFSNKRMSHGCYVQPLGKIFFWFPSSTDNTYPSLGIYFDPITHEMGRLYYPGGVTASASWRFVAGVTWADVAGLTWETVSAVYPLWSSPGGTAILRQLLGDQNGKVYGVGIGDGSDNGQPIEAKWELPLKSYAGWDKNIHPETFETFFRKTTTTTIFDLSLGYTDTLMDPPAYQAIDSFDISTDQRNDIDLAAVTEKRFITIRLRGVAPQGQVSWQGGLLHGEPTDIERGPTNG
jgi:hypothetical protein